MHCLNLAEAWFSTTNLEALELLDEAIKRERKAIAVVRAAKRGRGK